LDCAMAAGARKRVIAKGAANRTRVREDFISGVPTHDITGAVGE
jgi:hypothetical protein